jgi:hypothetical protein
MFIFITSYELIGLQSKCLWSLMVMFLSGLFEQNIKYKY